VEEQAAAQPWQQPPHPRPRLDADGGQGQPEMEEGAEEEEEDRSLAGCGPALLHLLLRALLAPRGVWMRRERDVMEALARVTQVGGMGWGAIDDTCRLLSFQCCYFQFARPPPFHSILAPRSWHAGGRRTGSPSRAVASAPAQAAAAAAAAAVAAAVAAPAGQSWAAAMARPWTTQSCAWR
jgi:hypothetical protein